MEEARINETMAAAREAGMNRRDRKKFRADLRNGVAAAETAAANGDWGAYGTTSKRLTAPPSWHEEGDRWTDDEAGVTSAFREVLGRDPANKNELLRWLEIGANKGSDSVAQMLALTDEARARGVDPTVYGNEAVDPSTFTGWKKEYYDEWAKQNPGATFYSGHLNNLQWQKDFGSIDVYRALGDGSIERGRNGEYVVTQAAIDRYGADKLYFTGYHYGDMILTPKDSGIKIDRARNFKEPKKDSENYDAVVGWKNEWESQGYEIRQGLGPKPHEGFIDRIQREVVEHTGMSEDAAATLMFVGSGGTTGGDFLHDVLKVDEGYFMTDPGGFTSGWFYGDEGIRHNLEGAARFLGMDKNDPDDMNQIARYQGYGSAAFTTALSLTGLGAGVSAALNAAQQMGRAQVGQQDWGTAVGNSFVSLVASRLGGAYGGAYSGAYNAAVQASSAALQTAITNEDSHTVDKQDIGTAAAVGALGSIAGGVSNAVGGNLNLGSLSQRFLNAATASAASYGGAYLSAWGNGGEVDSDSAAFNAILAGASAFGKAGEKAARNRRENAAGAIWSAAENQIRTDLRAGGMPDSDIDAYLSGVTGPAPPRNFGEWLSYEFGGLDENNEFSWFSNRRPGGKEPPMTAVQRAEQEFLGAVTPWATTYEIESMYGGNQRAAAPAAAKTPASVGKPSPWAPAQWPLVGGLFSTGGRHLSQGWNWATDAERAWIPG